MYSFFFINLIILTGFCFIRLDTADMIDLDYTKVWLEGEFDHSREVLIGYRPNFQPDRTPKGFKANFGLLVVTPFKLKDTGCVNVHVIFSGLIALIFRYTVNAVLNCLMSQTNLHLICTVDVHVSQHWQTHFSMIYILIIVYQFSSS